MTLDKLTLTAALAVLGLVGCTETDPTEPLAPEPVKALLDGVQEVSANPVRPFRLSFAWPHDPSGGVCTVSLPDGSTVDFASRLEATGNATHMGRVSSVIEVLECGFDAAQARFANGGTWRTYAANGDYIGGHWTGFLTFDGYLFNQNVIDYGTGRFEDAGGESDCVGEVELGVGGRADCTGWMTY